jgi:hypothetical protein
MTGLTRARSGSGSLDKTLSWDKLARSRPGTCPSFALAIGMNLVIPVLLHQELNRGCRKHISTYHQPLPIQILNCRLCWSSHGGLLPIRCSFDSGYFAVLISMSFLSSM